VGQVPKPIHEFSVPEWKRKLISLKTQTIDTQKDFEAQFVYGEKEVGMRHPKTQSHMKIFDNGNIEIFAGDTTGIVVSDLCDTVNLYGNALNINTYNANVFTRPYGLVWNGFIVNPHLYQLYDDDLQLSCTIKYYDPEVGWTRRSISIKPFIRTSDSSEYRAILEELGIPT